MDISAVVSTLLSQPNHLNYENIFKVDELIDPQDLERFHKNYEEQSRRGVPSPISAFNYAHALIKSSKEDTKIGIVILEGNI